MTDNLTVFISWAHGDELLPADEKKAFAQAWKAELEGLVGALEEHGLEVVIDYKSALTRGTDWSRYGPQWIERADRVLIVANEPWMRRFNREIGPGMGIGVVAEADTLLSLRELDHVEFQKKVGVVFLHSSGNVALGQLNSLQRHFVDEFTAEGVRDLVATLRDSGEGQQLPPAAARGTGGAQEDERYALDAVRLSDARRRRRLAGAGLSSEQIDDVVGALDEGLPVLEVPQDAYQVLTGGAGAGKSETAERFHRAAIEAFAEDGAVVPLWVHASDVSGALVDLVADRTKWVLSGGRAVSLVVDGLDEAAGSAVAQGVAEVLVRWPGSQVLVTSRERGPFEEDAEIAAGALGHGQARALMMKVTGRPLEVPAEVKELLDRPLFALLAARAADPAGRVPAGGAEVLDVVVREVLEQSGGFAAAYPVLQELAVRTVRAGRPVDPEGFLAADVVANHLLTSPFVTSSRSGGRGRLSGFAVATVEQWFAARALAEGRARVEDEIHTMQDFERWKWSLAQLVAVGAPEQVDTVMAALARWNPGAATWVVREVAASGLATERVELEAGEPLRALAVRLRGAVDAWLAGLGPMADAVQLMAGVPVAETVLGVGFEEYSGLVLWWTPRRDGEPDVILSSPDMNRGFAFKGTPRLVGRNWVWEWSQAVLAASVEALLGRVVALAATDEPTVASEWSLVGGADRTSVYPGPDLGTGEYSAERMRVITELVLVRALRCYRELTDAAVAGFGDTLQLRGLMPVRLFGNISHRDGARDKFGVSMRWCVRPQGQVQADGSRVGEDVVDLTVNDAGRAQDLLTFQTGARGDDPLFEEFRGYVATVPHADFLWPFEYRSGQYAEIFDEAAPALAIAVGWLRQDLRRIGWLSS